MHHNYWLIIANVSLKCPPPPLFVFHNLIFLAESRPGLSIDFPKNTNFLFFFEYINHKFRNKGTDLKKYQHSVKQDTREH